MRYRNLPDNGPPEAADHQDVDRGKEKRMSTEIDPPSPEKPVYRKIHQGDHPDTSRLFMITCDEGWRSHIVCADVYEHVADWLLGILGRKPYAKTPAEASQ